MTEADKLHHDLLKIAEKSVKEFNRKIEEKYGPQLKHGDTDPCECRYCRGFQA